MSTKSLNDHREEGNSRNIRDDLNWIPAIVLGAGALGAVYAFEQARIFDGLILIVASGAGALILNWVARQLK